jgi:hypothetical protein
MQEQPPPHGLASQTIGLMTGIASKIASSGVSHLGFAMGVDPNKSLEEQVRDAGGRADRMKSAMATPEGQALLRTLAHEWTLFLRTQREPIAEGEAIFNEAAEKEARQLESIVTDLLADSFAWAYTIPKTVIDTAVAVGNVAAGASELTGIMKDDVAAYNGMISRTQESLHKMEKLVADPAGHLPPPPTPTLPPMRGGGKGRRRTSRNNRSIRRTMKRLAATRNLFF